jgi:hypothetical protein
VKTALDANDEMITAGSDAPPTATCPTCGFTVDLRVRTTPDGLIWYWRHPNNAPMSCPLRRYRK